MELLVPRLGLSRNWGGIPVKKIEKESSPVGLAD